MEEPPNAADLMATMDRTLLKLAEEPSILSAATSAARSSSTEELEGLEVCASNARKGIPGLVPSAQSILDTTQ